MAAYDVTALDSIFSVSGVGVSVSTSRPCAVVQIDATHVVAAYTNDTSAAGQGGIRAFEINATTGVITALDSELNFGGDGFKQPCIALVDADHVIVFWNDDTTISNNGFAQIFSVNTSTWEITAEDSPYNFANIIGIAIELWGNPVTIDSEHVLFAWTNATTNVGYSQVFEVDNSTWEITALSTATIFDASRGTNSSLSQIDANHFILFYTGASTDGFTVVLEVSLSTWAVSLAGSALEFDTSDATEMSGTLINGTHAINFWRGVAGDGFTRAFSINTGTWAITGESTALEFDTSDGRFNSCLQVSEFYYINFWAGSGNDGFVRVFNVNSSSYAVTAVGTAALEFDTTEALGNKSCTMFIGRYVNIWSQSGIRMQAFDVEIPAIPYTPRIITLGI